MTTLLQSLVSVDFFTVPTVPFKVLFVFVAGELPANAERFGRSCRINELAPVPLQQLSREIRSVEGEVPDPHHGRV